MAKLLIRLTCSTPNVKRDGGAHSYYVCALLGKGGNYACESVEEQLERWLQNIWIQEAYLPLIREAYTRDMAERAGFSNQFKKADLQQKAHKFEQAIRRLADDYYRKGIMPQHLYEEISHDYTEQYKAIESQLRLLEKENDYYIAGFEDALRLLTKLSILYRKLEPATQRTLLLHVVKQVVLDRWGAIRRVELHPPFGYLTGLLSTIGGDGTDGEGDHGKPAKRSKGKNKNSRSSAAESSKQVALCAPYGGWRPVTPRPGSGCLPDAGQHFPRISFPPQTHEPSEGQSQRLYPSAVR